MRAYAVLFAFPVALGLAGASCAGEPSGAAVTLAPTILFPRGTLDGVKSLTLNVYDATGGVDCDNVTGRAVGVTDRTPKIASPPPFTSSGCAPGTKFCGNLNVTRSATPRIFWAVGVGATGGEYADGCTKAVVDQDQLAIAIKMVRFIAPATCGNMVVEPTEQCDPPGRSGDLTCDADCHSKEEWLSVGSQVSGSTVAGGVGEKVKPAFLWQLGVKGRFLSVWGDRSPRPKTQIALRLLSETLGKLADGDLGAEVASESLFIPNDPTVRQFPPPPAQEMDNQFAPAVALADGKYYVAFQDDHSIGAASNGLDIHLRTMDAASLVADQPPGAPLGINGVAGAGEIGAQSNPGIATGPDGNVFIVWQDSSSPGAPGKIFGLHFRTVNRELGVKYEVSTGITNQHPVVAGTSTGWVIAWESGTDVKVRSFAADGSPGQPEQTVNNSLHRGLQDHPAIAVIDGGRYAIAWADHGALGGTDIFVQRYTQDGAPRQADQDVALNNLVAAGEQTSPAIAASGAAGGVFIVTWLDQTSNHVRGRLVGGTSGFLFNNVDGSSNEFQASIAEGHARANPVAVAGGAGPFIAIGWEDLDPARPGIFARRFPVPTAQ